MKLSDYRNSSSWLGAIELGPKLMALAEELPASEEMGLSWQLRQLMVDLPTAVCADLVQGTDTRKLVGFRLHATLELVDQVYPALDTAGVRDEADALVERIMSDETFADAPESAPKPAEAPAPAPEPAAEPAEAGEVAVGPDGTVAAPEAAPAAAPTSVPVSSEPSA